MKRAKIVFWVGLSLASVASANLVGNPGFETGGFTNWFHAAGALVVSNNGSSATGIYAAEVPAGNDLRTEKFEIVVGSAYDVSWDYNITSDGAFRGHFRWWDASTNFVAEDGFSHTSTSGWTNRTFTSSAAPAGAVYADVVFFTDTATLGSIIVDNVSVEEAPPPPLVSNPGFETGDLTSWFHSGGIAVISDNGPSVTGVYAAEIPAPGNDLRMSEISVEAGETFEVSWDYKVDSDGEFSGNFRWFDSGGGWLGEDGFGHTTTTGWETRSFTSSAAPAGAVTADIVFFDQGSATTGSMLVDNISVALTPLVENSGFETGDFTGWFNSVGSTLISDNGPSAAGLHAAEIPAGDDIRTVGFDVTPGQGYKVNWDYKVVGADGWFWGKLRWYDASDVALGEVAFIHDPAGWKTRIFSSEAPAHAAYADVTFLGGTATIGSMMVDNVSVVESDPYPPVPEINITIERLPGASGLALSWNTEPWGNYTVLNKSSLSAPSWSTHWADIPGGSSGSLTVTTTVDQVQTFYQVNGK